MDPNETLRLARRQATRVLNEVNGGCEPLPCDAIELAELFCALDDWFMRGGAMPEAWHNARAKPRKVTPG